MGAENLPPPPGFDPRTVRPVASRGTDYAVPLSVYIYIYTHTHTHTHTHTIHIYTLYIYMYSVLPEGGQVGRNMSYCKLNSVNSRN